MAQQPSSSSGGGGGGRTAAAVEALSLEFLSYLDTAREAGGLSAAITNTFRARQHDLKAAAHAESALPLADPGRLFERAAALLDASSPRPVACFAAWVLTGVLDRAPARRAQAAPHLDALLRALIRDCAREGQGFSPAALYWLIVGDAARARSARRLGALEALARQLAGVPHAATQEDEIAHDAVVLSLLAAAELCENTGRDSERARRAFVAAPGVVQQAARWLQRNSLIGPRQAAAHLVAEMVNPPNAVAAAAALRHPPLLRAIADAVADAGAFAPNVYVYLSSCAGGAAAWPGAPRALLATPGFLDGALRLLAPAQGSRVALCTSAASVAYLLLGLTGEASPLVAAALPRFVDALAACDAARRAAGRRARGRDDPGVVGEQGLEQLMAHVAVLRAALAEIARTGGSAVGDRVRAVYKVTPEGEPAADAAGAAGGSGGRNARADGGSSRSSGRMASGGSGSSAVSHRGSQGGGSSDNRQRAPHAGSSAGAAAASSSDAPPNPSPSAAPSAAAAMAMATDTKRRSCYACGREDGGSSSLPLLQCGSCKGTGLKAFFCDKACLKAGWKAHKPACEAARQRRQDGGGAAAAVAGRLE